MEHEPKILSHLEYKKTFLPFLDVAILYNTNALQVYSLQKYLKGILSTTETYQTSFNFLIYLTQGKVQQQINETEYLIEGGECIQVRQGTHTKTNFISPDAKGYIVIYESEILTQYLLLEGPPKVFKYNPYYELDPHDNRSVQSSLELLKKDTKVLGDRTNVYVPIFFSILSRLRYYDAHFTKNIREFEIVYRFEQLVHQYQAKQRSVSFYANKLFLSENYLNRCMRNVLGKTTKQYINQVSIQYAKLLLRNRTRDVAEIAYELNFPSPSYFARVFKSATGLSPTEFRDLRLLQ